MSDRTVHCTTVPASGERIELVRYDRSGKWFYESGPTKRHVTLAEAVAMCDNRPAVIWHEGRPGGRMFDARVRSARAARKSGGSGS